MSFFDDLELAIVCQTSDHPQRSFATLNYNLSSDEMVQITSPLDIEQVARAMNPRPLVIARSRPLRTPSPSDETISLALNGRKGRRVGCVSMGDGRELEILDMDEDEGQEDASGYMEGVEEA